jgi:Protein of unknown function (DUF3224)
MELSIEPMAARLERFGEFCWDRAGQREAGWREGTFVLQDTSTVQNNLVSGDWFVVPGSGTGELAGLRGASCCAGRRPEATVHV